jgi:membrane-associated protease RseP (regulator of RpoE activity)
MKYRRQSLLTISIAVMSSLCVAVRAQPQDAQQPPKASLGVLAKGMHQRGTPPNRPVLVSSVLPGGAADRAGIRPGDVLMSMNGVAGDISTTLVAWIHAHVPGDKVQLTVVSGSSAPRTLEVTLAPRVDNWFPAGECVYGTAYLNADYAHSTQTTWGHTTHRLVATKIMKGTELTRAGVAPGDQILTIDGQEVINIADLQRIVITYAPGETVEVKYAHAGRTKKQSVTLGCMIYAQATPEALLKSWREMKDRPPIPEIVNRERILAEDSIREGDFFGASYHYMQGLAAYPYWPEGWFNVALVDKEQYQWGIAAEEMKLYLLLRPDASDAKAARESIVLWEDKAKRCGRAATPDCTKP